MSRLTLLQDLNDTSERWCVEVQVLRKWNVFLKSSPNTLASISFLLVDKEGTKIQASVISKDLLQPYKNKLLEGHTYKIVNFVVSKSEGQYRACKHPFKITLTPKTHIVERENMFVDFPISFLTLRDILSLDQDVKIDHLVDIVAYLKEVGTLDEYKKEDEIKHKMTLRLCDLEGNTVDCVLFDDCARDAHMCQMQNMSDPVVVVLNLARIAFRDDGVPQILNSFNATKLSFNPAIKQVKDMILRAKELKSPILCKFSQNLGKSVTQISQSPSFNKAKTVKISEIGEQTMGEVFMLNCEVIKLQTMHGWMYEGCPKCGSKPRVQDSIVMCGGCKKKVDSIEPKMKVHYLVGDDSGTASVIFWDRLAMQLIGKSAREMKLKLDEEDRGYDFPDELDSIIGKRMLLSLKLNDYNKKYPNASISVISYTLAQNLMEKFNNSQDEVSLSPVVDLSEEADTVLLSATSTGNSKRVELKVGAATSTGIVKDSAVGGHSVLLECRAGKENLEVDLTDSPSVASVSQRASKGKGKRVISKDEGEPLKEVQVNSGTVLRSLKIIKQEKM